MSDTTETTDTTGPTGSANAEQREAWNGQGGDSWVRTLDEHDAMLEPWLEVLAGAAAVGPGERVLDVGCGCGTTTLPAATACGPDGTALGLDISEPMLVRARELADAAGVTNARYAVGDAQVDDLAALCGVEAYDVAISRFGVMFFDDPTVAFANIGRAVRPGGRLAMVVWTPLADQQWLTVPGGAALPLLGCPDVGESGTPGMFGLADRDATLALLADAGWTDVDARFERRRMAMGGPGGVEDALAFLLSTGVGRTLFADVEPDLAERAKDAIREALTPHLTDKAVELDGASWVLTARRPD